MLSFMKILILILVSVLIFFKSYKYFKSNYIYKSLILIVLGGLILRGWCIAEPFLCDWDERYHALVAKHLIENPLLPLLYKDPLLPFDFRQWTLNHVWLHKQPLALWLIAISIKCFGNVAWAVRLPSLIASCFSIFLTFKLGKFFRNEKVGLLAAFLQAINGFIIEVSVGRESTEHIDTLFFFFIQLSIFWITIYLSKKSFLNLFLIGFWMGCAVLTKWLPALIVLPIFIILTSNTEGPLKTVFNTFLILITSCFIFLPWQFYIFSYFPKEAAWENEVNFQHLTEVLQNHEGAWWWYLDYARKQWNELIIIAFLWFLFVFNKKMDKIKWVALVLWILIPYIIFSMAATKMVSYILFTAPAIFIILSSFWWELKDNPLKIKWLNQLILTAMIVLAVRYCYERMWFFRDNSEPINKTVWMKNLNQKIKSEKSVIFNWDNPIEGMFYTPFTFYQNLPTDEQLKDIKTKGYDVYIVRTPSLPSNFLNKPNIQLLDF
jgi:4-amino-4-deoxy-L-arabinose transferase-like glycosyltransferase